MTDEKVAKTLDAGAEQANAATGADDELTALFSAFDDVSASDPLKAATLERISRSTGEDPRAASVDAGTERTTRRTLVDAATKASSGSRRRAKLRVIRVAAIAACLVLALTGGVAYATPTSYVTVAQGETAIDLGVNCFGITVSASSDDEGGQAIVDEAGLRNLSYEDALARTLDALYSARPDEPVEVTIDAGEGAQRERMQDESEAIMEDRAPDQRRSHDEASAPSGEGDDPQAGGNRPDGGAPAMNPQGSEPSGAGTNADPAGQGPNPQGSGGQPDPGSNVPQPAGSDPAAHVNPA